MFPAVLKKSIIFTIFRTYFRSFFVYAFSYSSKQFHEYGIPPVKTHSRAKERASHSRYSKFSFRREIRFSISFPESPSRRPAAECTLIHPPHSFDMDTVRSSFSLNTGSVRRNVIKNVGPANIRKNLRRSPFTETKDIFSDCAIVEYTAIKYCYCHFQNHIMQTALKQHTRIWQQRYHQHLCIV